MIKMKEKQYLLSRLNHPQPNIHLARLRYQHRWETHGQDRGVHPDHRDLRPNRQQLNENRKIVQCKTIM